MIEIDGEFFIDPCEAIRAARQMAAIVAAQMAATQIAMILAQPLFPPHAEGGIVVSLPNAAGDNLLNSSECIIGVDPGIKGGDISVQRGFRL